MLQLCAEKLLVAAADFQAAGDQIVILVSLLAISIVFLEVI